MEMQTQIVCQGASQLLRQATLRLNLRADGPPSPCVFHLPRFPQRGGTWGLSNSFLPFFAVLKVGISDSWDVGQPGRLPWAVIKLSWAQPCVYLPLAGRWSWVRAGTLNWAGPHCRESKYEEESNRKHLHSLVEALSMFRVIDLLNKSLIRWEEDVGNGPIWVQIQLQHLSCVALDDREQLSVGLQLKRFLGYGNLSAKTRIFPGKRRLLVTPDRLLSLSQPQFSSMKCGYLLPTSLLLNMQCCAFQRTQE